MRLCTVALHISRRQRVGVKVREGSLADRVAD